MGGTPAYVRAGLGMVAEQHESSDGARAPVVETVLFAKFDDGFSTQSSVTGGPVNGFQKYHANAQGVNWSFAVEIDGDVTRCTFAKYGDVLDGESGRPAGVVGVQFCLKYRTFVKVNVLASAFAAAFKELCTDYPAHPFKTVGVFTFPARRGFADMAAQAYLNWLNKWIGESFLDREFVPIAACVAPTGELISINSRDLSQRAEEVFRASGQLRIIDWLPQKPLPAPSGRLHETHVPLPQQPSTPSSMGSSARRLMADFDARLKEVSERQDHMTSRHAARAGWVPIVIAGGVAATLASGISYVSQQAMIERIDSKLKDVIERMQQAKSSDRATSPPANPTTPVATPPPSPTVVPAPSAAQPVSKPPTATPESALKEKKPVGSGSSAAVGAGKGKSSDVTKFTGRESKETEEEKQRRESNQESKGEAAKKVSSDIPESPSGLLPTPSAVTAGGTVPTSAAIRPSVIPEKPVVPPEAVRAPTPNADGFVPKLPAKELNGP